MLWSALARSVGFVPQAVATLLISHLVIKHYGVDAFASYALIAAVMLMIPLNGLGVGASLTQAVAAHGAESDIARRTGLTASRVLTLSALFLLTSSTALGLAGLWPSLLGGAGGSNVWTAVALAIYALSFVPGLGPSVLLGADRNHTTILVQSLQAPIALAILGLLLVTDAPAQLIIVVPATAVLLINLLTMGLSTRLTAYKWLSILRDVPWRRAAPGARIRSLSGPMLVTSLCVPIAFLCDRLVLSHVSTPSAVADYTVVVQIFAPVTGLIVAGAQPLWPMYTRARARGENGPRIGAVVALFLLATVAVCSGLVLVSDRLGRIIGGEDISLGYFLPAMTALVMCLQAVAYPLAMSLMDPAGARFVAVCAVLTLPINISVSVVLSREFGASGPLISLLIVSTCVQVIPTALFVRHRGRSGAPIALA